MSTALERARGLLDSARLTGPVDDRHGYLDLLGPPETAESSTLWVMQNAVFAAVYERAWRPIFTRLYSLGGTSAAKFDRRLVTHLGRPGDRTILDVACGPGNYTRRLSERLIGDGVCIGLDFSVPMVTRAVADNSGHRVAYVRGDAHRLPFPDGSIDTVCCLAALYLISDPHEVIDELARVVAPGGEVAIFTSLRTRLTSARVVNKIAARSGYRLFGRDEVTDRLRAAGLVDVEQTITGQAQYVTARKP
ncbi:methyltransferase type 11 [Williamsia sp. 1138]|uniref:class I SAM-dependent methyltransferase n=1 Tax=Williamsia sp. 1138 TaxID=1903117 RepID=UPI000B9A3A88|nr:class I SAM-dependent methyltransferase [Williamsia sp. 1138]OZG30188.1 methyltransferase type 11 [Williamsia sp. 1138]